MEEHGCQPDLWTYNAMISVYGRCGLSGEAERLFKELHSKCFLPDAVTYNSLLYAFAREGNVVKVKEICPVEVEVYRPVEALALRGHGIDKVQDDRRSGRTKVIEEKEVFESSQKVEDC